MDLWALWPDGHMCPLEDVWEFNHRSDDYHVVEVTQYEEDEQTPKAWHYYLGNVQTPV